MSKHRLNQVGSVNDELEGAQGDHSYIEDGHISRVASLPNRDSFEVRTSGSDQAARDYSNSVDGGQHTSRMRSTSVTTADGTTVTGFAQSQNRGPERLVVSQGAPHTFAPPDANSVNGYLVSGDGERKAILTRKPIDGFEALSQSNKSVKGANVIEPIVPTVRRPDTVVSSIAGTKAVPAEVMRQQALTPEVQGPKPSVLSERASALPQRSSGNSIGETNARLAGIEVRHTNPKTETSMVSVDKLPITRDQGIFQEPTKLGRGAGEVVLTSARPVRDTPTVISNRCEARAGEADVHREQKFGDRDEALNASRGIKDARRETPRKASFVDQCVTDNSGKAQANFNSKSEVSSTKPASVLDSCSKHQVIAMSDRSSEFIANREITFKSATVPAVSIVDSANVHPDHVNEKNAESPSAEEANSGRRAPDYGIFETVVTIPENLVSGRRGPDFTLNDVRTPKTLKGDKSPGFSAAPKLDISLAVKLADSNTKKTMIDLIKMLEQGKVDPTADASSRRLVGVARQIGPERLADLRQLIEKSENGRPPRFEGVDEKTLSAYRRILTLIIEQIGGSERKPSAFSEPKAGEGNAAKPLKPVEPIRPVVGCTHTVVADGKKSGRDQRIDRQPRTETSETGDAQRVGKRRLDFVKELLGAHQMDNVRQSYVVRFGDTLRSIALKHPQLQDVRLWTLLARFNTISTQVDHHGAPRAMLNPGRVLLIPNERVVKQFQNENFDEDQNDSGTVRNPIRCFRCKAAFSDAGSICGQCRRTSVDSATTASAELVAKGIRKTVFVQPPLLTRHQVI